MKKLLVWLVKKFITKDALKAAIHAANKRIAEKPASERTQQVMAYGEDAAALTAAYLKSYANDGRIDDAERAARLERQALSHNIAYASSITS